MAKKSALVVSAHAADFVWRCGGAIALHQKLGYEVTIVCLSFGERGESGNLWKRGKSQEEIKTIRRREAENAASALEAHDIQFYDLGDYPLVIELYIMRLQCRCSVFRLVTTNILDLLKSFSTFP